MGPSEDRSSFEESVLKISYNMKVLIAVVFAIGSVSALGSGPYLPSGWRPQGPSFYLPSEVAKPTPSNGPLKANLIQETEASGSDALREYGPPKLDEVVQVSVSQSLPDVATEQTFFVQSLATQELESAVGEIAAVEATTEQSAAEEVSTTEAQLGEIAVEVTENLSEVQPTFESRPLDVVAEIVETTEGVALEEVASTAVSAQEESLEVVVPTAALQEEVVVPAVAVQKVAEGVNNIAEAIVKLENEVKAAEALEAVVDAKEVSGSLQQAPEGFLEYGPPGFREYGPPKQEDIARSAAVQVAPTSAFENNEVRRRRFSPRFRTHKKH